jgi:type I restriction enzyme S subunit
MKTLSEIFKISKGKKAEEVFINTGLRYIQIGDLRNDDVVKYTNAATSNVLCNKDDILIAWDGANAGTVGYNLEGVIGSTLAKLSPKTKNIHSSYVGRFLQSKFNYLRENCTGATIPHLSRPVLESLQIPLPPLYVQQKIASILDAADTLRQKDKALLAKYDELTQALFLDMFGDPVSNPKGWEVMEMKECTSKIGSGSTPRGGKEAYLDEGISLIRSMNVYDNQFKYDNLAFISDEQANKLKNVTVEVDDVLFNITGASVCRCTIVPERILPARVNQHVSILRVDKKRLKPKFLSHLLISENVKRHLLKVGSAGGAIMEAITKEQLEKYMIPIPPLELQNQFAERVAIIEQQKAQAQASLEKSEELFNSLLQKAFNGELVEP